MGFHVLTAVGAVKASNPFDTVLVTSVTGSQNNYAPGLDGNTLEEWAGASDATFTGLASGNVGQRYTFRNTGTKVGFFAHQSGSSSAGNKFKNPITSAAMPVAPGGFISYTYDGTDWLLVGHAQGLPISVAYAAGNFGAAGATWTVDSGDQVNFQYVVQASGYVVVWFDIRQTTVATAPGALDILVPGGFTVAGVTTNVPGWGQDNGVTTALLVQPAATGGFVNNVIRCFRQDLGTWGNATNTTQVRGQLAIPVT